MHEMLNNAKCFLQHIKYMIDVFILLHLTLNYETFKIFQSSQSLLFIKENITFYRNEKNMKTINEILKK